MNQFYLLEINASSVLYLSEKFKSKHEEKLVKLEGDIDYSSISQRDGISLLSLLCFHCPYNVKNNINIFNVENMYVKLYSQAAGKIDTDIYPFVCIFLLTL